MEKRQYTQGSLKKTLRMVLKLQHSEKIEKETQGNFKFDFERKKTQEELLTNTVFIKLTHLEKNRSISNFVFCWKFWKLKISFETKIPLRFLHQFRFVNEERNSHEIHRMN